MGQSKCAQRTAEPPVHTNKSRYKLKGETHKSPTLAGDVNTLSSINKTAAEKTKRDIDDMHNTVFPEDLTGTEPPGHTNKSHRRERHTNLQRWLGISLRFKRCYPHH